MTHRLDDIGRDALRDIAADIIADIRGPPNPKLSKSREIRWGNFGSLALQVETGLWFDHELERGGDIIRFIELECGCSFIAALDYAAKFVPELRGNGSSSAQRLRPRPRPTVVKLDDDKSRIAEAVEIWCEAHSIRGTTAEKYLNSRGIELPVEALDVLRFHPRCPWMIGTRPAMVALVCDVISDEPLGVHRTALTSDGRKLDRPKLLGPTGGGVIKLGGEDFLDGRLVIGEGIETALSATMLGYGRAWSVLDAGGIAKFPALPSWINHLTIAVDNDVSGTGQKAATECKARWLAAGCHVRTVMSPRPGEDLNDILQRRTRRLSGANVVDLMRARGRRHG